MEERYLKSLENVGLTNVEAKAYLALTELKESQTGVLCEKSKIPSSKIYFILESLIKKGFASYRMQNNIKVFIPSSPEIIKDLFEEKQKAIKEEGKEIENLIENLRLKQVAKESFSKYRYFEGLSGIKALWLELTEELKTMSKEEPICIYTGVKETYKPLMPLYEEFHKVRSKNKIKYKIIYPLEETEVAKKRSKQLAEVRFMKLENEAEWGIMGNKFFIQYLTQEVPRAFIIEDEIFSNSFRQVFEQVWRIAKQ